MSKQLAPLISNLAVLATTDLQTVDEKRLCNPESLAIRDAVVAEAENVEQVIDGESQEIAVATLAKVNGMAKQIEDRRALDKAPFLKIGKWIDATAAEFKKPLEQQAQRIRKLLSAYQVEVERKAAEERRRQQAELDRIEAEKRRIEQEAAAAAAAAKTEAEAKAAAEEAALRQAQLNVQAAAAVTTPEVTRAEGMRVRHPWKHEVTDAKALYAARGEELVELKPRTAAITKIISSSEGKIQLPGVRFWQETDVNA
jgi:colicin import membrane protein